MGKKETRLQGSQDISKLPIEFKQKAFKILDFSLKKKKKKRTVFVALDHKYFLEGTGDVAKPWQLRQWREKRVGKGQAAKP